MRSPELPAYLRRLGEADELAVLVRLFLLGVPVARDRVDELVGAELRALLAQAGLLVDEGAPFAAPRASSLTTSC